METGSISKKIERGKHTTRHSEIIPIEGDTYIMDTPGFSTLYIPGFQKEDLQQFYPEFAEHEPYCRFKGCSHINEPECGVKDAVAKGDISKIRYENYKLLYQELKDVSHIVELSASMSLHPYLLDYSFLRRQSRCWLMILHFRI